MPEPTLVLVTGPPGAGKTTLARGLADELGLPLVEKDAIKEVVGGALGITDRPASTKLGGAVFDLMSHIVRDLLQRNVSVIAEGNFAPQWSLLADLPACRLAQVHVTARPEVLECRLSARNRHGVHYDRDAAAEIAERAARGEWSALAIDAELIELDTSDTFTDARDVASHIAPWIPHSS